MAAINALWRASEESIRRSVANALSLVGQHRFSSVAFPVLGAGSGGFDHDAALRIMQEEMAGRPASGIEARIVVYERA